MNVKNEENNSLDEGALMFYSNFTHFEEEVDKICISYIYKCMST